MKAKLAVAAYNGDMENSAANLEVLRPQLAKCLADGLPGPAAQRPFAPELAYGRHAGPPAFGARQAAVLVLAYPHAGDWYVPTIVRTQAMKEHAGQIALPGGSVDAGETPAQTALREFEEELGASPAEIDLLGPLTPIYVFNSNFYVHPFLGLCAARPDFKPNGNEVAEMVEIPLRTLLSRENHSSHKILRRGVTFSAPHIQIGQHRVWGATCMILAEVMALVSRCAVFS